MECAMAPQSTVLAGTDTPSNRPAGAGGEPDFPSLQRASEPGRLDGVVLLQSLSDEDRRALELKCMWLVAKEDDQILSPHVANNHVIFIVEGKVAVVNYSLSGREVNYALFEAGEYLGEMAAIDGGERSATVRALTPCKIAALDPQAFQDLLMAYPAIALQVLQKLAKIVRNCDERIMDLATLSAYQRVYSELLKLVRPDPVRPDSWLIYPLPTQAQIASKASTTRETVARVLSQLQQAGITERKAKTLYIRELERLKTLADRVSVEAPVKHAAPQD